MRAKKTEKWRRDSFFERVRAEGQRQGGKGDILKNTGTDGDIPRVVLDGEAFSKTDDLELGEIAIGFGV